MYGHYGIKTLEKTIRYAKLKGMFVITDGKRNDIGATMEAYTAAHLGSVKISDTECEPFGADALTVNGYLGSDGINPLLEVCKEKDRGIFVLVKTSNKSSGELQDKLIDGTPVYAVMGDMCEKWGSEQIGEYGYSSVGAVVGATYPEQLSELRKRLPHTMFLVPGYGAQGGGAQGIAGAFDENGLGAIVNSSRAVMCAYKNEENSILYVNSEGIVNAFEENEIPVFAIVAIKPSERVIVENTSTRNSNSSTVLQAENGMNFVFEFDEFNNITSSTIKTRTSATVIPDLFKKIYDAKKYSDKNGVWQRDYIYYNISKHPIRFYM